MKEVRVIPFGSSEYTIYISERNELVYTTRNGTQDLSDIDGYATYSLDEFLNKDTYKHNRDKIIKILKEKNMYEYLI
jgi:hypothetical protein